jgi:hypothetical protein
MGRAYIVVVALKYFGMSKLDDKPTVHVFPDNLICDMKHLEDIDTFFLQKQFNAASHDEEDHAMNYGMECLLRSCPA